MIRRIDHTFHLEEWELSHLSAADQALLEEAHQACKAAYSPYSNFNVGCAVRLETGQIIHGSNQENAAYPSGLCGERVAFFAAGAQCPGEAIVSAAVVTDCSMPVMEFSPCGGCRQVMLETEERQQSPIRFLMQTCDSTVLIAHAVSSFLPMAFKLPQR